MALGQNIQFQDALALFSIPVLKGGGIIDGHLVSTQYMAVLCRHLAVLVQVVSASCRSGS